MNPEAGARWSRYFLCQYWNLDRAMPWNAAKSLSVSPLCFHCSTNSNIRRCFSLELIRRIFPKDHRLPQPSQDAVGRRLTDIQLKRPRARKTLPVVLSRQEALALVVALPNIKHRAILSLLYSTGLRLSEVLHLKPGDIDSGRGVLRVEQGKGKKSREVGITPSLIGLLRQYYRIYRPLVYLFEGRIPGRTYSATSVRRIVHKAAQCIGLGKRISVHTLRHSYASHMLEAGVNLKRLQMLLGHNSMKTTSGYLHLCDTTSEPLPDLLSGPDKPL